MRKVKQTEEKMRVASGICCLICVIIFIYTLGWLTRSSFAPILSGFSSVLGLYFGSCVFI